MLNYRPKMFDEASKSHASKEYLHYYPYVL